LSSCCRRRHPGSRALAEGKEEEGVIKKKLFGASESEESLTQHTE